jgi:hypothetical protein
VVAQLPVNNSSQKPDFTNTLCPTGRSPDGAIQNGAATVWGAVLVIYLWRVSRSQALGGAEAPSAAVGQPLNDRR